MTKLNTELAEYQRQFESNRSEAADICAGLSKEQFNLHPGPDRWSIAECLLHLNVSASLYAKQIRIAVEKDRRKQHAASPPYRYGFLARWMIRTMEPPPRKRYKSPERFNTAGSDFEMEQVLGEFTAAGKLWSEGLAAAEGLHLGKVKVASPASSWLRFPLGALFAGMAAHERRHLWQARQIRDGLDAIDR